MFVVNTNSGAVISNAPYEDINNVFKKLQNG